MPASHHPTLRAKPFFHHGWPWSCWVPLGLVVCLACTPGSGSSPDTGSGGEVADGEPADGPAKLDDQIDGEGEVSADADLEIDAGGEVSADAELEIDGEGEVTADAELKNDTGIAADIVAPVSPWQVLQASLTAPSLAFSAPDPSPWQGGDVVCGPGPGPWAWAGGAIPQPLGCTATCAPVPHAVAVACAGGQCLAAHCEKGWQDRDGIGANGCEIEVPVTCTLFVDAAVSADVWQDGSQAYPFADLHTALDAAAPGCRLELAAGVYAAAVVIAKPGIVLHGAGPKLTRLVGATNAVWQPFGKSNIVPAVKILASDVVLEGLAVVGGRIGVSVEGSQGLPVLRPLLRNVAVGPVDLFLPTVYPGAGAAEGIRFQNVTSPRIVLAWIHDVGSNESSPNYVVPAAGVKATGSTEARFFGVRVDTIRGNSSCSKCSSGGWCDYVESGGNAVGIMADGAIASGCSVGNLIPGNGGSGPAIDPNNMWCGSKSDGAALGYSGVTTDATDLWNGRPLIELKGCKGGHVLNFKPPLTPLRIQVADSNDFTVGGNHIAVPKSGSVGIGLSNCVSCTIADNVVDPGAAMAISADKSPGIVVTGNLVQDVKIAFNWGGSALDWTGMFIAGAGCTVAKNVVKHIDVGRGDLVAIDVSGVGCTIQDNIVEALTNFATPGSTTAIRFTGLGGTVVGNRIGNLSGPGGAVTGSSFLVGETPQGGAATGIRIIGAAQVSRSGAWSIHGGTGSDGAVYPFLAMDPGLGIALDLAGAATSIVSHFTCVGAEICLRTTGPAAIETSILAQAGTCAIQASAATTLAWSDLWQAKPCVANLGYGKGQLAVDPQFADAPNGDLHLLAASACINAGPPAEAWCSEPVPNGCAVDLGAYGGTSEATAAVGATQCVCP